MGRASRSRKGSNRSSGTKVKRASLKDHVDAAEECTARCEYDEALTHYEKALTMEPENARLLDAAAEVLLELGQVDQARQVLTRSVQLEPTGSYVPYMYLAQLSQGVDALACFERGVALITTEIQSASEEAGVPLRVKLAEALCGKAELYMTDLCDTPNAEAECQAALEAALQTDSNNVDALLTAANFCVCQQNRDRALEHLDRAAEVLRSVEDDNRPPPQVCMTAAKMYVELEEHEKAIEQFEEVLVDDDELVEAHYMLGVEYKAIGEVEHAKESVTKAHALYQKDPEPVPEIMQKIMELAQSLV
eukprot:TRINITY_DN22045_c0_g1_i1.p1 TRINITY_DN22045_c0_g1~~TRINITY_DN22045_c0_g1_i1.p1  ORF type:complete len:306 (-),score=103.04 TRINITY_DN22045_c0_g1_i1:109-1026(-)